VVSEVVVDVLDVVVVVVEVSGLGGFVTDPPSLPPPPGRPGMPPNWRGRTRATSRDATHVKRGTRRSMFARIVSARDLACSTGRWRQEEKRVVVAKKEDSHATQPCSRYTCPKPKIGAVTQGFRCFLLPFTLHFATTKYLLHSRLQILLQRLAEDSVRATSSMRFTDLPLPWRRNLWSRYAQCSSLVLPPSLACLATSFGHVQN
jgi:hypothetical protein